MIRAVIDTNILVSGLLSPSGNEALIILAILQALVRPCLSEEIITEYISVLGRPKFMFPPDEIIELIAMLRNNGETFQPEAFAVASPDPGDTKFLYCAMTSKADFLVTGNKRDFPDEPYGATRIVNARELLDRLTLEI